MCLYINLSVLFINKLFISLNSNNLVEILNQRFIYLNIYPNMYETIKAKGIKNR